MGTANEKMCEGMNDAASQPLGTTPGEREHANLPWSCAVCTYRHGGAESSCLSCSMCSTPRSKGAGGIGGSSVHGTDVPGLGGKRQITKAERILGERTRGASMPNSESFLAPKFRCPCCHLAFASNDELMDHHLEVCGLPPDDADHYTVLGLTKAKHLTADDIKRAYRLLSLRIHPDRAAVRDHLDEDGPIKSGKLMMRVNEAYKVLGDPSSRKDYDRRGSCIHQAVMYAKHQHKGAPGRFELRNGMSGHKVDPRELLLGDHVYYYMPDMLMGMYQHHGIVSYVGGTGGATDNDSVPDIMIIDFGIRNRNRAATKKRGNVRSVREVPLRGDGGFLPAKTTLMRARYGESSWQHNWGFGASYKDLPDEPKTTVLRARRLLCLGNADYDALENSCETIAFFCKTGLRYTGQTTKTSNVLAATGGATGLTGVLLAGASGAGTFDVTTVAAFGVTVGASLTWVAVVATGVVLIGVAGMMFYRRCKRHQLKGTQSLEAIAAMTKLKVRERAYDRGGKGGRHYSIASTRTAGRLDDLTKNLCSAPGVEVDVSDRMEQAAEIVKSGMLEAQDEAEAERAASRTKRRSAEMETKGEAEESKGEATSKAQSHAAIGADELLPWIISVLEQCEVFNAILDLPDVTDRGGETAFYCAHLKAAEVELAELDPESSVVGVGVSTESASDDSVPSSEVNSPLMSNQSTKAPKAASTPSPPPVTAAKEEDKVATVEAELKALHATDMSSMDEASAIAHLAAVHAMEERYEAAQLAQFNKMAEQAQQEASTALCCADRYIGTAVRLLGLTKAPMHNGKQGVVESTDRTEGRLIIQLADGAKLAVKPENLELVVPMHSTQPTQPTDIAALEARVRALHALDQASMGEDQAVAHLAAVHTAEQAYAEACDAAIAGMGSSSQQASAAPTSVASPSPAPTEDVATLQATLIALHTADTSAMGEREQLEHLAEQHRVITAYEAAQTAALIELTSAGGGGGSSGGSRSSSINTNGWGGGAPFVREDGESRRSQSRSEKAHAAAWGDHADGRPFQSDPEVKSAERGGFVVKAVFKNGNVVVSRKTAKEFLMLHRELSMAHRNARDLALPQVRILPTRHLGGYRRPRRDNAAEYASYLGKCLALITAEHMDGVGLGDYLAHLEDVNVDRAIRSFLHTGCEVLV